MSGRRRREEVKETEPHKPDCRVANSKKINLNLHTEKKKKIQEASYSNLFWASINAHCVSNICPSDAQSLSSSSSSVSFIRSRQAPRCPSLTFSLHLFVQHSCGTPTDTETSPRQGPGEALTPRTGSTQTTDPAGASRWFQTSAALKK